MTLFVEIEICLLFVLVVLLCVDNVNSSQHDQGFSRHPSADFTHHTIVKPVLYHKKSEKKIHTTKESDGFHVEHVFIKLDVDKQTFELDLVLNKHLLADGFFHRYQESGRDKIYRHNKKDSDLCEYHGKVRGKINSWVALSSCEGLNGVIFDGKELHYISSQRSTSMDYNSNIEHYFYSHSNVTPHNKSCDERNFDKQLFRFKRNSGQRGSLLGPYNADKLSKYVELLLVIDNREYIAFGSNKSRVIQHGKTIINLVNAFYSPLNIFVVLIGIVIWTERDEVSLSDGANTLSNFAKYRKNKLLKYHPNDNAQLLGKFHLGYNFVGRGYTGGICSYDNSVAVNEDHSNVVGIVAGTIAHELGHNFGMEHDDKGCKCPGKYCIMAPVSSTATTWSSCSLQYLMLSFTRGLDYCLRNQPKKLLDYPVCGNGFVETGEECDCGLHEFCDNACCNATSCMLKTNASCASGACCDLSICKLKDAGTLCRSADYECDLPEYCTGKSEFCPKNTYKMDTEPCGNGKAYCHQGYCRTRTDQCKLIWGLSGESCEDQAYDENIQANEYGNCGYNAITNTFKKCQNEDKLCGLLQCHTLNESPEFGLWGGIRSFFKGFKGPLKLCRSISSVFDSSVANPNMVPNGAPCGVDKICVNQKCLSVSSLRRGSGNCSINCKNGWCNNLGHCHCKDGFAPPSCESYGPGGSEDSGPATLVNHGDYNLGLYIVILVIVLILAALVIWCYLRHEHLYLILRTRLPSLHSFSKYLGGIFTYAFQACSYFKCLKRGNSRRTRGLDSTPQTQDVPPKKPEITIDSAVLVSTTNLEVTKSLTITEARKKLKTIHKFSRHEISEIAMVSYPKNEENEGNVRNLARAFENPNFKENFI